MSPRTPPTAATQPPSLRVAPGQSLWTCLEPGCRLYATQGEVALRLAPRFHSHMAHRAPLTLLKAGEQFPCTDSHHAIWVELGNTTRGPAEVKVVHGLPQPGLARKAWALLRSAFAGHTKERKGGQPHALQVPQ